MKDFHPVDILLVEDNPNDAELMVRALKQQHLLNELFVAEDGEQALDFIFNRGKFANRDVSRAPKVILLDLKLPKINGLEVLREIKSNPLTQKIPVVVVTSSSEDPDVRKAYELGINSYVVKPVNFDDFAKTVQNTGLYWLLVNEIPQ